jgi:uncharacterized DUF497 family protein
MDHEINFIWDHDKAKNNKEKHGISFELATQVFYDPHRIEKEDLEHSTDSEKRMQTIGKAGKVLFVVYTERTDKIRLISARLADKNERRQYLWQK